MYPLTVIVAGAGYGKTTALVQYLSAQNLPVGWYNPGPEDDHVYSFSAYLAGALNSLLPGLKQWYLEKTVTEEKFDWKIAFSVLMAGIEFFGGTDVAGILVVDDWQYVETDTDIRLFFDRFLACCPSGIHVVIISREPTNLPEVERNRAKGGVLDFTSSELTFELSEIEDLFGKAKALPMSKPQVRKVFECTEGWIIAIKLLANQWQGRMDRLADTLSVETSDLDGLFEYLAQDVLGRQTPELQEFLLQSALVESFTLSYCKEIFDSERSTSLLNIALKKGLFIYRIGQGFYRYHTLFREFLCREAELRLPNLTALYAKIGYYYWKRENAERALHFLILGEQWETAQKILCEVGRRWVSSGRDRLLYGYLEQLPAAYRQHPEICLALGDAARFSCLYDQAIDWYKQAGQQFREQDDLGGWSRSCRGIGEAYLDIIQPIHAQSYLKQAYQSLQAEQLDEKAALLGLMAENMINQGDSRRAERYRRLMVGMLPCAGDDKNNLQVRILLRTGHLFEVVEILERRYEQEQTTYHVPRSFRETPLVLSLCYAYMGQADRALKLAQAGIESAEKLRSPFVAAVGYVRQGHALLLHYRQNREQCRSSYQKALNLAERLGILRGQTEVYQGQCLMHALDGDWLAAKRIGTEGIKITERVRDEWFTAILYHTLGMAAALCGFFNEAKQYLTTALQLFEKCRDLFGQTVCYWWLTFEAYQTKDSLSFTGTYACLVDYCKRHGYDFLLEKPSLLGDIAGFSSQPFRQWSEELQKLDSKRLVTGPAKVPLVLQTLGPLKVWRDGQEISPQEWRRVGAKQLLCLLLTLRMSPTNKEKLMLHLWPEADGEAAARSFRVVFNHLSNVLDPERQPRMPCRFIARQGAAYKLVLGQECQLDVDRFEALLADARNLINTQPGQAKQALLEAMELYQGEYLAGENIDEISLMERERLEKLVLQGVEMLAALCVEQKNYDEAIGWTERILQMDACWEKAYQLRLICYGETGNSVMLARTYQRCLAVLEQELGVKPSPMTRQIFERYNRKS
jgi:DNA-binding SARP family transcriptional activator